MTKRIHATAKTRGGKYSLVLTGDGEYFNIESYTNGHQDGCNCGIATYQKAETIFNQKIIDAMRYDGINYTITIK